MSMDRPNEYEQALEAYAEAVRNENDADKRLLTVNEEVHRAREIRQEAWRVVKRFVIEGKIQPGIYRINRGTGYADGILIEKHGDYPDLHPMFR